MTPHQVAALAKLLFASTAAFVLLDMLQFIDIAEAAGGAFCQ